MSAARTVAQLGDGIDLSKLDPLINNLQKAFPRTSGAEQDSSYLARWAGELPETGASVYLRARLSSDAGDWESAATAWNRFFQLHQGRDQGWVLQQVRALAECGRTAEASLSLRPALTPPPKYSLLVRAERLIQRLSDADDRYLREA